jgi:uncharacterized protein
MVSQVNTLSADVLEDIISRLVKDLQPEQIILFGSHAYGTPNQDSDVDLLVIVADSDQPRYRRARAAYRALRGILVPKDVIVMTRQEVNSKADVPSSFVSQALSDGIVLYG